MDIKKIGKAAGTAAGVAVLQVLAQHTDEIISIAGASPYASVLVTLIALILNPFKKN